MWPPLAAKTIVQLVEVELARATCVPPLSAAQAGTLQSLPMPGKGRLFVVELVAYMLLGCRDMSSSSWKFGVTLVVLSTSACDQHPVVLPAPDAASVIVDSGHGPAITRDAGCEPCLPDIDADSEPPTAWQRGAPDAAAPSGCKERKRPDCSKEPCTWADAKQRLPACVMQPLTPFFQQRCGEYDALVGQGTDSYLYRFYDKTGELVATAEVGIGGYQCDAFESSFMPPEYEDCRLITPKCSTPVDEDAGA
jgi:hypothetical protein